MSVFSAEDAEAVRQAEARLRGQSANQELCDQLRRLAYRMQSEIDADALLPTDSEILQSLRPKWP